MELNLYNYLRREGLTNQIVDFREEKWQKKLEAYDVNLGLDTNILSNIKGHLKTYNSFLESQQSVEVNLRYYQILSLYFSKIYFNKRLDYDFQFSKNSLAYWMATGSGKTIIMHLNILQYLSDCKTFNDFEIIMTTPGVNLIEQHERELIPFIEFLNKSKYQNKIRLTIDTTQALTNKPNDFFEYPESKNYKRLILVDEAHIGLSTTGATGTDGAFMELRRRLNIKNSFLFEYSATFHNINSTLEREYEKSIVYDYNYNFFYRDGYGKDYFFQKIGDDVLEKSFDDNLHHNLQVINEKIQLWTEIDYSLQRDLFEANTFPDKPLIAFMGNTVNNKVKSDKNEDPEVSDITKIINFLASLSELEKNNYSYIFNNDYQGRLTLTKNPDTDDEILLSFGNGDYWGIVNVGNGTKFINDLKNKNVVKNSRDKVIISNIEKYSFRNIDDKKSPINILIGSRKFAEGWNCFRVSVIGLINLGTSKGNKIIQIFGRGVRIKGIKNDGKRNFFNHNENYFKLSNQNEEDKLRKIETLCVFSLKKSYLETFTNAVNRELEIQKVFEIKVSPSIIRLNDRIELRFEEFSKRIPIFKLSKIEISQRRVRLKENQAFEVFYKNEDIEKNGLVNNFRINLDYRTDNSIDGVNIKGSLLIFLNRFGAFIDYNKIESIINEFQEENSLHISHNGSRVNLIIILSFINEVVYKSELDTNNIDFICNLVFKITSDFLNKIKNKVNWYINNSNYEYNECLKQSQDIEKGDFIDKYYILKNISNTKNQNGKNSFKSQSEIDKEIKLFEDNIGSIAERLKLDSIGNHIYYPLLRETKDIIEDEHGLMISPDKLNSGEKKFIEDAAEYFSNNFNFDKYEVYLMRNVDSLKSVGIYLNDDSQVFYPDFILWLIGEEDIYINFIDPKGQMGMQDTSTLYENEKVRIADKVNNDTLSLLERELSTIHRKNVKLNSFILLRDSSDMGTIGKSMQLDWQLEYMISRNILRLNWHDKDEKGSLIDSSSLPMGKNYLQLMIENTLL